MQKTCQNCGKVHGLDSQFCAFCGSKLIKPPVVLSDLARDSWVKATMMALPQEMANRRLLREWWHGILADHGRYKCYAFFLCLPSDTEAIQYLKDFGRELDMISRNNCLVIALSKSQFRRAGFDNELWNIAVDEQVSDGYSVVVAEFFNIKFTDFPCIIVFNDIRSGNREVFTLKGLTAREISAQLRMIFSLIQEALTKNLNPLVKLRQQLKLTSLEKVQRSIFERLSTFAGKTVEAAMEAWIKTAIK